MSMSTSSVEKSSKTIAFQLKGSLFTLTVLHLLSNDMDIFQQQLQTTIAKAPKFFENAPIVIDLNDFSHDINHGPEGLDLATIAKELRSNGLIPVGIRGGDTNANKQAAKVGLAIMANSTSTQIANRSNNATESAPSSSKNNKYSAEISDTTESTEPTAKTVKAKPAVYTNPSKVITQPVRSGQQIYAKGGDLIILSTVSHGAEVLADGHIHIYGALRGRALAGILGNTNARIFCKSLEAELISIAGRYLVSEQLNDYQQQQDLHIFLDDDQLIIKNV